MSEDKLIYHFRLYWIPENVISYQVKLIIYSNYRFINLKVETVINTEILSLHIRQTF